MNRIAIAALVGALLAIPYAEAKLPPAPPLTPAEQAEHAAKAEAAKAKTAAELTAAEDRAVANYRKNKGIAPEPTPAKPAAMHKNGK